MQILQRYIVLFVMLWATYTSSFAQQWQQRSPMPTARKGLTAAVLEGKIWVIGGSVMEHNALNTVEVYDPATDTWTTNAPNLQYARTNCTARTWGDKIFVFGGRSGHQIVAAVEMYDPVVGDWQTVTQMPTPRYGVASVVADSAIWLIGGSLSHNNSPSDLVEKYFPAENRWQQLPAKLTIARSDPMAGLVNDEVFVFGGYFYGPLGNYEKFNSSTATWQSAGNMLFNAASSGYAYFANQVWIIGGMGQAGGSKSVQIFEHLSGDYQWSQGPPLNQPRRETAAVVFQNRIYLIGGHGAQNMQASNMVVAYEISTDVESNPPVHPADFVLQNYPNPFATQTTFVLQLPAPDVLDLSIYDIVGREVAKVFKGALPAGEHRFSFSPVTTNLPSGIYFARLRGDRFAQVKKIHLLR